MKRRRPRGSVIWYNVGKLLLIVACCMLLPILTALWYREPCLWAFVGMLPVTLCSGFLLIRLFRPAEREVHLQVRDGAAIVTYGWILAALFGMMPYLLSGTFHSVADAFFESMSGFATVGASVLDAVESAPRAILMWRSVTHWLGGMGIIVLFVALLSSLGAGALQMFRAEAAGPVKDKLQPKIADSARSLWLLYLFNTGITFLLLLLCGMSPFDAVNHAFSVVATGGFSTKNNSIGAYDSPRIEWVLTGAMYMAGINYALLYAVFRERSVRHFWKNREFRAYTCLTLAAVFLVTLGALPQYPHDALTALRQSAFHVTSILSTTGFVCCDYEQWAPTARVVLLVLMFSGACAGSTTCGFKIDRHVILLQQAGREIKRFLHPRLVRTLRASEKRLSERTLHSVATFFYLFVFLALGGTLLLCAMGLDMLDAFSGTLSCLAGVGPAMGILGPTESFSAAPAPAKVLLSALMLIGRLEIYTVLAVFWPDPRRRLRRKKLSVSDETQERLEMGETAG